MIPCPVHPHENLRVISGAPSCGSNCWRSLPHRHGRCLNSGSDSGTNRSGHCVGGIKASSFCSRDAFANGPFRRRAGSSGTNFPLARIPLGSPQNSCDRVPDICPTIGRSFNAVETPHSLWLELHRPSLLLVSFEPLLHLCVRHILFAALCLNSPDHS